VTASRTGAAALPGFAAGLLGLDIVMNLAGLRITGTAGGIAASILQPSIDLLVILAALMGIPRTGDTARAPLRVAVGVLAMVLVGLRAAERFAWSPPGGAAGWIGLAAAAAACGAAVYALAGLVLRGFANGLVRAVTLLLIALGAVGQVLLSRVIFTPSIVPRLVRLLFSGS
jgi:hypothetical protein